MNDSIPLSSPSTGHSRSPRNKDKIIGPRPHCDRSMSGPSGPSLYHSMPLAEISRSGHPKNLRLIWRCGSNTGIGSVISTCFAHLGTS
jgi:hypothetical protein